MVLSYYKESFHKDDALKPFVSLDSSLKPLDILTQYKASWVIEPFFRGCKKI